jgi:coenzyme F420 hydrogenase subunit beta
MGGSKKKNIEDMVAYHLCLGCGICENACPSQAITMTVQRHEYRPVVDRSRCKPGAECGLCHAVCPGGEIATRTIAAGIFPEGHEDALLGRYVGLHTGHSTNEQVRFHSGSGGVLSSLLCWLLETGQIQGALVTRFRHDAPTEPLAVVARTPQEVLAARSSKCCPVQFSKVLREIEQAPGQYAVVGMPCHLHGIRKLEIRRPGLRRKIAWHFGLLCSTTRNFAGTEYVLQSMGVRTPEVGGLSYRDEGRMGSLIVTTKDGSRHQRPYKQYYPSMRSFFTPFRCTLCHDFFAELADMAVGDIQVPAFAQDKIGINSVITRSRRAEELLERAAEAGVLTTAPLERASLVQSQCPTLLIKKKQVPIRLKVFKLLGKRMPQYDAAFPQATWPNVIRTLRNMAVLYGEGYVGKHRRLWGVIDWLNARQGLPHRTP